MNNMEIKQGDRVRVSKDAPWLYVGGLDRIFAISDSVVTAIEDDNAAIKCYHGQAARILIIPTKYLVKVDAEAKEPKFKVGDKVRYIGNIQEHKGEMFVIDGDIFFNDYYKQWQASSLKTIPTGRWSICNVLLSDLEPDTAPAAPKIKAGDRVRFKNIYELQKVKDKSFRWMLVMFASKEATITAVEDNGFYRVDINPSIGGINDDMIEYKVEPTEHTEAEKKPNIGSIKIPVEVDLTDSYWDAYTADLAKEIALKVANKFNTPEETAEYAVKVAKAVVEGLKRK